MRVNADVHSIFSERERKKNSGDRLTVGCAVWEVPQRKELS